jgi:hydroxymethylglutaryl-CoA lyase
MSTAEALECRLPNQVTIRDVSPRDGLQALDATVPTEAKVELIDRLAAAGVTRIEATSFVRASAVPQMADAARVMAAIQRRGGTSYEALVPNERGAHDAIACGADRLLVIVAVSEPFALRNVNMTPDASMQMLERTKKVADASGIACTVSVTTAFGCAYAGAIPEEVVFAAIARCVDLGVPEVVLSDTVGAAHPGQVRRVASQAIQRWGDATRIGLHLHDTRGMGLANLVAGLGGGVDLFDASLGGLGGCPFVPNAAGNICTEDAVHMLAELGVQTGIDVEALCETARLFDSRLGTPFSGRVMVAGPRWRPRA